MRRLLAVVSALVLVVAVSGSSVAAPSRSMFVGDFEILDRGSGDVIGRVVANLVVPTADQLVAGTYDFTGAPGYEVLAGHGQLAIGSFHFDPNFPEPGGAGVNVGQGEGVECEYYGPNEAICREWLIQFIDYVEPGIPSQIDVATRIAGSNDWDFYASYGVGRGSFNLKLAPTT